MLHTAEELFGQRARSYTIGGIELAERLIRMLKKEEVHLNAYEDIHEARARIGHFITQVYHQS